MHSRAQTSKTACYCGIAPPSRIGLAQKAERAPALQQAHMPKGHIQSLREFLTAERIDEIEIPNQFSLPLPPTEARAWNLADSSNPYQHEIASV